MKSLFLFLTLLVSQFPSRLFIAANPEGFSVEIFHRDSIRSPLYNPSATVDELAINAAIDSTARANHFASVFNGSKFSSTILRIHSVYLMELSVGSPPIKTVGHVDTGSDPIWVQSLPCKKCQKQKTPFFDPHKSTTFKVLPCSSSICESLLQLGKCGAVKECSYALQYGSKETSNGVMAMDKITLHPTTGKDLSFPNIAFGCGIENNMRFHGIETGIFGFARGKSSFVSQLGDAIQNKFSYCLFANAASGKIKFGADVVLAGPGAATTPLYVKKPLTYYIINLEAITIGNQRIVYDIPTPGLGNMVSDSGSTLNQLADSYYLKVEAAVRKAIPLKPYEKPLNGYKLCYDKASFSKLAALKVVYHFTGGADVTLKSHNAFMNVNKAVCFATIPGQLNIYGSTAQLDFVVSHDLAKNKISFAPADCTKF